MSLHGQKSDNFWKPIDRIKAESSEQIFRKSTPFQAYFFQLDVAAIKAVLQNAPERGSGNVNSNVVLSLPNASGGFDRFKVIVDKDVEKCLI